jgi:sulfhydrogenase subunit gamma (sulfur reductase)
MVPSIATILDRRDETPDIATYHLGWRDERDRIVFRPGQFLELSVFGAGEAPFCLASSARRPDHIEVTVRRCGRVTDALATLGEGDEVGIRGPFGNGFDLSIAHGHDLLFVGGGIGLPPLRGLLRTVLDERDAVGRITVLYGARTPADLVYKDELAAWQARDDMTVGVTVDRGDDGWTGNVGLVPVLFDQVELRPQSTLAFVCGPPVMIQFVIEDLLARGFAEDRIFSTLERMMQCGVGKCNHCCVGERYLCRDGPVFTYREIREMWE